MKSKLTWLVLYMHWRGVTPLTDLFAFLIHREAVPALEREYNFWMQNRSIIVEVEGAKHILNRYNVQVGQPRYSKGHMYT